MTRFAPLLFAALLPLTAQAQTPEDAILDFMEAHCLRPFAAHDMHTLPGDWRAASDAVTRAALPNLAVGEAAEYAAFATAQNEALITDPSGRWWPLIDQAYEGDLLDVRGYVGRGWYKLFIHGETGANMVVDSGLYDPQDAVEDWASSACWLWHPDHEHPLNDAILNRWDLAYGNRVPTPAGHKLYTFLQAVEFDGFEEYDLSINVDLTQPNTDYRDGLARVVLRLEVIDWR